MLLLDGGFRTFGSVRLCGKLCGKSLDVRKDGGTLLWGEAQHIACGGLLVGGEIVPLGEGFENRILLV